MFFLPWRCHGANRIHNVDSDFISMGAFSTKTFLFQDHGPRVTEAGLYSRRPSRYTLELSKFFDFAIIIIIIINFSQEYEGLCAFSLLRSRSVRAGWTTKRIDNNTIIIPGVGDITLTLE